MSRPENTPGLTGVDGLFTYHIFGYPAQLPQWRGDIASYALEVTGCVTSPRRYSLAQIADGFRQVEDEVILQCMTNVHWGRIRVKGARLYDVLQEAQVREVGCKVALAGAEGFTTDLFLEEIDRQPDNFLLIYEVNDPHQRWGLACAL